MAWRNLVAAYAYVLEDEDGTVLAAYGDEALKAIQPEIEYLQNFAGPKT